MVMDITWRGMADDDIKFPGMEKVKPFAENTSFHFTFMVLMLPPVVPPRSGKTCYTQALLGDYLCMNIGTANRGRVSIPNVMIPCYVEERNFVKCP